MNDRSLQKEYRSLNMDSLVSIFQDKLWVVRKELKEAASSVTDKAVRMAQPPPVLIWCRKIYTWPNLQFMNGPRHHWNFYFSDQDSHFVSSCSIALEMHCCFLQQCSQTRAWQPAQGMPCTTSSYSYWWDASFWGRGVVSKPKQGHPRSCWPLSAVWNR